MADNGDDYRGPLVGPAEMTVKMLNDLAEHWDFYVHTDDSDIPFMLKMSAVAMAARLRYFSETVIPLIKMEEEYLNRKNEKS